jgi:predicted transcriptional regulator
MNSIPADFQPQENALRYDPKTVEMSLIKLENYGLVTKCRNHQEKKPGHRPPDFLYASNDITEVLVETKKRLEDTTKDMLGLLAELENTEEDSFWYKSQMNGGK